MSEERPPPDAATLRAAEILARIHQQARERRNVPPQEIDRAVIAQCGELAFELGVTTREQVERMLGTGFSYPARGWHTYATLEPGRRAFLSLFYRGDSLIALELYVPRGEGAPKLVPRDLGAMHLEPGDVRLGAPTETIAEIFTRAAGGPGPVVYDASFEARFPGGVAYAMARRGTIERLALYAAVLNAAG